MNRSRSNAPSSPRTSNRGELSRSNPLRLYATINRWLVDPSASITSKTSWVSACAPRSSARGRASRPTPNPRDVVARPAHAREQDFEARATALLIEVRRVVDSPEVEKITAECGIDDRTESRRVVLTRAPVRLDAPATRPSCDVSFSKYAPGCHERSTDVDAPRASSARALPNQNGTLRRHRQSPNSSRLSRGSVQRARRKNETY